MAFRDSINDLMFRFYERFKQNNNRLPVSVDADINLGDVQIGTVKQGAKDAEAEPWDVNIVNESPLEVQLKGSLPSGSNLLGRVQIDGVTGTGGGALPVVEARISAFRPSTVEALTTTRLDTSPLPNRRYVDIILVGAGTGYIGNSDVTGPSNGIPVTQDEGYRIYAGDDVPIYGIGGTFFVVEVA